MARRPSVLVVAAEPVTRRVLRTGLEIDGMGVVEATSATQARGLLVEEVGILAGAIVDDRLDGGRELAGELASSDVVWRTFVLVDDRDDAPAGSEAVLRSELSTVGARLDGAVVAVLEGAELDGDGDPATSLLRPSDLAVALLRRELDEVVHDWRELCHWDPMLPPDALPAIAPAVVEAVVDAMARPQPLGWGPDPEVEKVSEVFGAAAASLDVAVGQLVCLREAVRRRLVGRLTPRATTESVDRLSMIVDRAIGCCVAAASLRLERDAHVDPLTGLGNLRALERDLRRLCGRVGRAGTTAGLLLVEAVDLRSTNDTTGHAAGDDLLQRLGSALLDAAGDDDAAYRVSGDEMVVLGRGGEVWASTLIARAVAAGAPRFAAGIALVPDDGTELSALLDSASARRRMPGPPLLS